MTWLVDLRRFAKAQPGRIGPGRLVVVVGPSGAGKDTLIAGAKLACNDDPTIVFPKRVITRLSSPAEDNAMVSEPSFIQSVADGEFALWWEAHGHHYGIPSSIDDDIRSGRTVVCNVSRTVIGFCRRRYAAVTVVLVTAPLNVLEARVARRARPSDGNGVGRLARSANLDIDGQPDVVIRNVSAPEVGVRRLVNAIRDVGIFVVY